MQNDTCYILALVKRDDGERILLGSGYYEFNRDQKHFNPNAFANDVMELQGEDGQLLTGQVRRSSAQSFDGYIGDGTTSKTIVEQKRREFFLFFRKQHRYTVVYIMPDGTAIKRDRGYIVDAPAVQELYQVQPKWHIALAFEDVNYYSYAEDEHGNEIYSFTADLSLSNVQGGGLEWDANGAISTQYGLGNIRLNGDIFQQTYTGKNLFNYQAVNNLALGQTILESNQYRGYYAAASGGDKFTVSRKITTGNNRFRVAFTIAEPANGVDFYGEDGNKGHSTNADSATSVTVTVPAGMNYIFLYLSNAGDSITESLEIQLERGDTKTSYEKFVGGVPAPNPSFPQSIQKVTGDQTIVVNGTSYTVSLPEIGKNLFNGVFELGTINGTTGANMPNSNYIRTKDFIPVTEATDYVISSPTYTGNWFVYEYKADKTYNLASNKSTTGSFTTESGTAYVKFRPNQQVSVAPLTTKAQIEAGTTPTAYEQFGGLELCKIDTYQDYIWKDGDDWKIHKATNKVVLDGAENWAGQGYGGYTYAITSASSITQDAARDGSVVNTVSDYFITSVTWNDRTLNVPSSLFINQSTANPTLEIRNTQWATVSALKTWLTTNRPTVYYALATPTDTAITDAALITQLDAVAEAMEYHGKETSVTPTGSNLPVIMSGTMNDIGGYKWDAASGGGPSYITVNGVDDALPVWYVTGPCANPTLTNSSTGVSITWTGTVPSGQTLIVDMGAQTATMEGANVFQYISGSWITLSPGTNRISYTAANTTDGSKLSWNEIVG